MAFRKRSFKRKTFRRGPPLARVRRTWFPSFRANWCEAISLPLGGCEADDPENDFRIVLVDDVSLQQQFSDRARVKRVVGDIWWHGEFLTPPQDIEFKIAADFALNSFQAFYGLKKETLSAGLPFGQPYEPMLNDFDMSEAQWLKTWQYATLGRLETAAGGANIAGVNFPVAESDVSTTHLPCAGQNNFVTGTGTFCVSTVTDVNCYNCENSVVPTTKVGTVNPSLHHFHLDWKRSVSLRENEVLLLQLGFVFPFLNTLASNEPVFNFFGSIKTLLEF